LIRVVKYTLLIPQAGVVRVGLLNRVTLAELCLLDYFGGWFFCKGAKRATVDGREYVWIQYEHAVEELPLLFSPDAVVATRKNSLSRMVQNLREARLVETVKVGRDLYVRPSDLAASLTTSRAGTDTKRPPTVTPARDDTVTPAHDDSITPFRDDSAPSNINQTPIKEETIKQTLPHCPPAGESVNGHQISSPLIEEQIYNAYPRKVAKPIALRAIRRALEKYPFEFLLERTRSFAASYNGDPQFIPHPTTWFNGERFNDDPATWTRKPTATSKTQPKVITTVGFDSTVTKLGSTSA